MKRTIFVLLCAGLVTIYLSISTLGRYKARVVFCDVGQGDALYFRLPNGADVLVDTGKDTRMIRCLNRHMPLFDRTIEAIFITHAQADHAGGLSALIQQYTILSIYTSSVGLQPLTRTTYPQFWQDTRALLEKKQIIIRALFKEDKIWFGASLFTILWPPQTAGTYTNINLTDPNNTALGIRATIQSTNGIQTILLLSDIDSAIAEKALQGYAFNDSIWKVNHHGSRNGISRALLRLAQPTLAVISSGKGNIYGHPHKETLDLLKPLHIPIRRTDLEGDVIIAL